MLERLNRSLSPRDKPVAPRVNLVAKSLMYYIYILQLKYNKLYTGFTADLRVRYKQHINGLVKSTSNLRPLKLIYYECYILEEDARRREKFLKTSEGKRFLNRQISSYLKLIGRYKDF